jgi:hypothetical protein
MENREWMYTGRVGRNDVTPEWIRKTDDFMERAYGEAAKRSESSLMPVQQMCQPEKKTKEGHGRRYLEEWIYVGLYSVDLSW